MTLRRKIFIVIAVFIVCALGVVMFFQVAKPSPEQRFSQGIHSVSGIHYSEEEIRELLAEYCDMEFAERAVNYGDLSRMVGDKKAEEIVDAGNEYCEDKS